MILETLSGVVERVTFYGEESGYTVLRMRVEQTVPAENLTSDGLVTVVGNLAEISPGESLRLRGVWMNHARYGRQFQVESMEWVRPASLEGIRLYLGSGLIKGVGPVTAGRIVDTFGPATLEIIEKEPRRLREVPGVGRGRCERIARGWDEHRAVHDVMLFLHGHGVSTRLAVSIYKAYGDEAIPVVEREPYRLAQDIHGIGFRTADKIAHNMGMPLDAPARIEAGLSYTLNELSNDGHVCIPRQVLVEKASELLEVEPGLIKAGIDRLLIGETLIAGGEQTDEGQGQAVYLASLYYTEVGIARRLIRLAESPTSRLADVRKESLDALFADAAIPLSRLQHRAIQEAVRHKVSILTGGPGTGKTTALRALIDALRARNVRLALASPTGRAAKRLSEATAHPAQTIHRMLGWTFDEGFIHNETNPLMADMVVVDEASMLDAYLTNSLLKAIHPDAHLLLVGDVDQLPSVGPGNVLRDMINSDVIPVTRLDVIFRQAQHSLIVRNAHRINRGAFPLTSSGAEDFFLFTKDDPAEAADLLVDIVQHRIPERFGLDPLDDVQVLAPMYRGPVGVNALNMRLQAVLNQPAPHKVERRAGGQVYRVGDKVLQTRNDYHKEVFNGDIGRIVEIDRDAQELVVRFADGRVLGYESAELPNLIHAFAISVHRSQGSEYPCMVMPVMMTHYLLLQRNLLYTAVTRAKSLVVLVGQRRAIGFAVNNNQIARRYTFLAARLRGEL